MLGSYIKCGKIKIDRNTYQLVIDTNYVRDYFRLSADGNGEEVYSDISSDERKQLNMIFNGNFEWFLYSKKEGKHNKVDKIMVISGMLLAISIYNIIGMTTSYILDRNNPYSSSTINSGLITSYNIKTFFRDIKEQLFDIEYDIMSIEQIIENNKDIPVKYKGDISEIYNTIYSKLSNQQFSNIKSNLYNLKIKNKVNTNPQFPIEGSYSNLYDCITIYCDENLKDNRSTLSHEFLHLLPSYYDKKNKVFYSGFSMISKYFSIGSGLNEGMTEFLNETLLGYYGNDIFAYSYPTERACVKMLCEIIGTDKMVESYFNSDLEILVNELIKIDGTREDALKLITTIDSLHMACRYEDKKLEVSGIVDEVLTQMIKYYFAKTSRDIDNNVYTRNNAEEFNITVDYFKNLFFLIGKERNNLVAFNIMERELLTKFEDKNNTRYTPKPFEYSKKIITKEYFHDEGERFVIKITDYCIDSEPYGVLDESTTRYNYIYVNKDNNAVKIGGK
ncbi:MAG: hypothetical protein PHS45_03445 [Bacilli bacterium]|nr:hypothetical protein [Bacilli bacterium]